MPEVEINSLLGVEEKKLTVLLPANIHRDLKQLAYANSMTMKELIIESYLEYVKPKYGKEVR